MQLKIKQVKFEEANGRCICGKCQHRILKVIFENGDSWCPTNTEMIAIKQMGATVTRHNLDTDMFCFEAPEQLYNIMEVFK